MKPGTPSMRAHHRPAHSYCAKWQSLDPVAPARRGWLQLVESPPEQSPGQALDRPVANTTGAGGGPKTPGLASGNPDHSSSKDEEYTEQRRLGPYKGAG